MKSRELAKAIFVSILKRYLFEMVVEKCKREYSRIERRYVVVSCISTSRLKCPCCQKYVLTAKYTQHLSKCSRRE